MNKRAKEYFEFQKLRKLNPSIKRRDFILGIRQGMGNLLEQFKNRESEEDFNKRIENINPGMKPKISIEDGCMVVSFELELETKPVSGKDEIYTLKK